MEIEGGFEDLGNEGVILDGETHRHHRIQIQMLKYKYDLGYEGAVLHETGKTDHHQSSREQSSRLSLHAAGAVDRRPDVFLLENDSLKKIKSAPGEGAGGGHGGEEGADDVARAQSDHLLARVQRLSAS